MPENSLFSSLSQRLTQTIGRLSGKTRLTEDNIKSSLREIRIALLEADVALSVVKDFIEQIREKAVGQTVAKSLRPGQAIVKIVNEALIVLLGGENKGLNLQTTPPAVILMAGLQGSGKTTTTIKLAKWISEHLKKSVVVTSTDIYRPAAIQQLATLAEQTGIDYHPSSASQKPVNIAKEAVAKAKKEFKDTVIIDTAGRLHIDSQMMEEIKKVHAATNPVETLLVVDSMTGQDAAITAREFSNAIPLTGIVLTKTDGDARGGAALSMRNITGKPIKFMGTGEKVDAFELFHPDRVASRILGMGDILSLVEEVERKVDKTQAEKLAKKLKKGKQFTLQDFLSQLAQMRKIGGVGGLLGKLPGMGQMMKAAKQGMDDKEFNKMEAIILSMTPKEREFINLIKGSRKRRIAAGSGTQVQDVNRLLKQFMQMQKMMKKMKGGGMQRMMHQFKGKLPPGFPPTV